MDAEQHNTFSVRYAKAKVIRYCHVNGAQLDHRLGRDANSKHLGIVGKEVATN